jgi:hypothetical protein
LLSFSAASRFLASATSGRPGSASFLKSAAQKKEVPINTCSRHSSFGLHELDIGGIVGEGFEVFVRMEGGV